MEDIAEWQKIMEQIMDTIAGSFGEHCEVVLHDLKGHPYEHSIIAIRNGHITGRKVGDPSTNKGLAFLRIPNPEYKNEIGYFTKTATGKSMKSSSAYFHDKNGKLVASLCINYDISNLILADNTIRSFAGLKAGNIRADESPEYFPSDISSLLGDLIHESISTIGKPSSLMSKDEKREGIRYLDERGVFLIKKSSDQVCLSYGISQNALYSFLEEIRNSLSQEN